MLNDVVILVGPTKLVWSEYELFPLPGVLNANDLSANRPDGPVCPAGGRNVVALIRALIDLPANKTAV